MSVELEGTALVADDLYLLAHHEVTGNPLLQPRPPVAATARPIGPGHETLTGDRAMRRITLPGEEPQARQVMGIAASRTTVKPLPEGALSKSGSNISRTPGALSVNERLPTVSLISIYFVRP